MVRGPCLAMTLIGAPFLTSSTSALMTAFAGHTARCSVLNSAKRQLCTSNASATWTHTGSSRKVVRRRHQQQSRLGALRMLSSSSASATPAGAELAIDKELEYTIRRLREELDAAQGRTVVLTGAGVSTDSGIPDYRGPQGSYSRGYKPMTHDEFTSSEANRKRYWARSTFGWSSFSSARPNTAHFSLAALESAGNVGGLITQNVDGLHQKAGSQNVIDLHGRNDKVECLSCGLRASRNAHQGHLARLNVDWIARYSPQNAAAAGRMAEEQTNVSSPKPEEGVHASRVGVTKPTTSGGGFKVGDSRLRADGDADIDKAADLSHFEVPACIRCGGVLKPSVVFFGDNIPRSRVDETYRMVDDSKLLLVAGSSLQVYSAFRLVDRAAKAGKTIAVINRGGTRAETSGLQLLKVEAGVSTILPQLL